MQDKVSLRKGLNITALHRVMKMHFSVELENHRGAFSSAVTGEYSF